MERNDPLIEREAANHSPFTAHVDFDQGLHSKSARLPHLPDGICSGAG